MKLLTTQRARELGYGPLTDPYNEREEWMLTNAMRQLAGIDFCCVGTIVGIELWRKGIREVNNDNNTDRNMDAAAGVCSNNKVSPK
jgi:hypothetical protein